MGIKQYSRDFKIGVINQVIQEGKSVSKVTKELELENEIFKKVSDLLTRTKQVRFEFIKNIEIYLM